MKYFFHSIDVILLCEHPFCPELSQHGPPVYFNHGKLKVSDNGRFLTSDDGTPFFYPGDTVWELFYPLSKDDAEKYPENQRANWFTMIQAVGETTG